MINPMAVVFFYWSLMLVRVMSVVFDNLRSFWEIKCLQGCFKIYGWVFKILRLSFRGTEEV